MKKLEDKIRECGRVLPGGVLKVDSFVNHQIDIVFAMEMADEFVRLFSDKKIDRVLTIEASGIAIAALVAERLEVPLVFAKKTKTSNLDGEFYSTVVHSYTHGNDNNVIVSKAYLPEGESVLVLDDFLASGEALVGLTNLVEMAGSTVAGCGAVISKTCQGGEEILKGRGYKVEALARIEKLGDSIEEVIYG